MKVKEESEKVDLKLNIQKTKIMASSPITSWEIVSDFIFLGSKITADGDCSHEIKRHLLLGRKIILWTEELGRLQSMGSLRVGHDWATSLSLPFHALEKEMATHSSVLAWRIPGMGEPGGLPSMGSHRVGHDWSDLVAAAARNLWRFLKHMKELKTLPLHFHI